MSLKSKWKSFKNKVSDFSSSTLGRVANVAINPLSLNGGALSKVFGGSFSKGLTDWNLGTALGAGALGLGASGAIGGLGSFISSNPILFGALGLGGMNLATSMYSANQQAQMQQEQNEINMQMMREMNEYNSPLSQMERYRQAGLNPNLLYSQIGSGNQSSPVSQQAVRKSAYRALNFDKWMQGFSKQMYTAQLDTQKLENAQRALDIQQQSVNNSYDLGLKNFGLNQKRYNLSKEQFEFDKRFKNSSLNTRINMFNAQQKLAYLDYQLRKDTFGFNRDNRKFNAFMDLLKYGIEMGVNSFSPIGIVR